MSESDFLRLANLEMEAFMAEKNLYLEALHAGTPAPLLAQLHTAHVHTERAFRNAVASLSA